MELDKLHRFRLEICNVENCLVRLKGILAEMELEQMDKDPEAYQAKQKLIAEKQEAEKSSGARRQAEYRARHGLVEEKGAFKNVEYKKCRACFEEGYVFSSSIGELPVGCKPIGEFTRRGRNTDRYCTRHAEKRRMATEQAEEARKAAIERARKEAEMKRNREYREEMEKKRAAKNAEKTG